LKRGDLIFFAPCGSTAERTSCAETGKRGINHGPEASRNLHIVIATHVYIEIGQGGISMKQQEKIKIINIVKNTDKEILQKLITEKISRIISFEYNKT